MIDYAIKFICNECHKDFVHYVENRGFKVMSDDTYIVVQESNRHAMCPYCDALQFQKQWRSGILSYIYIMIPKLKE